MLQHVTTLPVWYWKHARSSLGARNTPAGSARVNMTLGRWQRPAARGNSVGVHPTDRAPASDVAEVRFRTGPFTNMRPTLPFFTR